MESNGVEAQLAAALVGVFRWWREDAVLFSATVAVLVIGEVAFLSWMSRRHGALPRLGLGTPPAEIASVYRRFFVGLVPVAVLMASAWWLGGVPAGSLTAFVLVTAGLWVYERAYATAARATRARLA